MRHTRVRPRGRLAGVALVAVLASGGLILACGDSTSPSELVASIVIDPPTAPPRFMAPGTTAQLTAVAYDKDGKVVADVPFAWTSSNAAVLTVSSNGLVHALAEGRATVSAAAAQHTGTVLITVAPAGARVEITPAAPFVDLGGTLQLTATVYDAEGTPVELPVSFTSETPAVATVTPAGLLTGVAVGEATIVATSGSLTASTVATVTAPVASVTLDQTVLVMAVDDTVQLVATAKDAQGRALNRPAQWTSSNPAAATVDETGTVVGKGIGSTTVSANVGGKEGNATVTVGAKAALVTITSSTTSNEPLRIGATLQLTASVKDALGNVLDRQVTWSSSSDAIATVDENGLVTGVARGTATITARSGQVAGVIGVRVVGESEETTGNNLSVPAIFAEGIGLTGQALATETGLRPLAAEGIAVDALPFFYSGNVPDCGVYYCQGGSNVWQAEWQDGSALGMQSAEVSWGDNLTHARFNTHQNIRIEVKLNSLAGGTMQGFNMPYVVGEGSTELQGTDGTRASMTPALYSVTPRLIIQKLDDVTRQPVLTVFDRALWESYGGEGPGRFAVEINKAGAVTYGYNLLIQDLTFPSDVHKFGWWRIIFTLDQSGQVGGATVQRNVSLDQLAASDEDEPPQFPPQFDAAQQMSWVDINVISASGGGGGGH